ncbi:MAG TPA: succinate dehydrogenase hydrophobic membrane anchor subunit [Acidimicrobiales bacterium]|jgi:succinate dehydrogenase membrane anchor subunit|nr:succinate dehydrogenase hydrophobic membrane anchor subunit [Acidimicrobiales bacterium]
MAVPIQERPAGTRSGRRPRQNFETWSWFFMRVSGLVLLFLALVHFSITHLVNDVTRTNSHFVSHRWNNPLWRIFDWTLLALGLFHGVNGVRLITDDYVRSPGRRAVAKAVVYTLTFVMVAYGTFAIVSFTPFHGSP